MIIKFRSIFEDTVLEKTKIQKLNNLPELALRCKPFLDAYTYGYEILYPYLTTLEIRNENGEIKFYPEKNWEKDSALLKKVSSKPVGCIDKGFFGLASGMDIQVPEDFILRVEPHPSTALDDSLAYAIPGHIETNWWPSLLFLVFRAPKENQSIILKKNDPIAQFILLPKNNNYLIQKMTEEECLERQKINAKVNNLRKNISKAYEDKNGNIFDSTYKKLSKLMHNYGTKNLRNILEVFSKNVKSIKKILFKKNGAPKSPEENS